MKSSLYPSLFLLAFALGAFSVMCGIDGDLMINASVALRFWSGQRAYQDFSVPHGPVAGWLLSYFFRLLPTFGIALVVAGGALNGVVTLLVTRLVEISLPADNPQRAPLQMAGALTAVWFLPIMGGFYHDHLAFAWVLAGFLVWNRSVLASALFLALAYHTKQTVALGGLMAMIAVLLGSPSGRRLPRLIGSFLLLQAGVALALKMTGKWESYWQHAVLDSYYYALSPYSQKHGRSLLTQLFFPFHIAPVQMVNNRGAGRVFFYPVVVVAYLALLRLGREWQHRYQRSSGTAYRLGLGFLLLSTLWGSALLGRSHAHLFFGMGGVMGLLMMAPLGKTPGRWPRVWATVVLAAGLIHLSILRVLPLALSRPLYSQELSPISTAGDKERDVLERWRRPLALTPGEYAVVGDSFYLLSLEAARAPVNPLTIYTRLTVPMEGPDLWEKELIQTLQEKKPELVLLEPLHVSTPRLLSYLNTTYPRRCRDGFVQAWGTPAAVFPDTAAEPVPELTASTARLSNRLASAQNF